jgi:hypothetical protein
MNVAGFACGGNSMVVRIIVLIVFGGFGLFMLYVGSTQFIQQRRLLSTTQLVDAEIVVSEVRTITETTSSSSTSNFSGGGRHTTHSPEVQFSYEFQGVSYQSDMIYPTTIGSAYGSYDSVLEELKPFPAGARVKAFVSSAAPDKAFLKPVSGSGPVVFMIVGLLLPPIAWLFGKLL